MQRTVRSTGEGRGLGRPCAWWSSERGAAAVTAGLCTWRPTIGSEQGRPIMAIREAVWSVWSFMSRKEERKGGPLGGDTVRKGAGGGPKG